MGLVVAPFVLSAAMAQSVYVVDDDGGIGIFSELQDAINTASVGDVVLVKSGTYSLPHHSMSYQVTRGISVVADLGASVSVDATFSVRDLPAGETARVRGLQLSRSLAIVNCFGTAWIEDCTVQAATFPVGASGCTVSNSDAVVMQRCSIAGATFTNAGNPGSGIFVNGSTLHAYDSTFTGGTDITGGFLPGPGAPGMFLNESFVFAQDCECFGGGGGDAILFQGCNPGGAGGAGVDLFTASSTFLHRNTATVGGPGGTAIPGCPAGANGLGIAAVAGSMVTALTSSAALLEVPGPAREQQPLSLDVTATAGDSIALGISIAAQPLYFAPFTSTLLLDASLQAVAIGTVPASGTLSLNLTSSALPTGVDATTLYLQAFGIGGGVAYLGSGVGLTILGAGF